jgi:hypothetical protein
MKVYEVFSSVYPSHGPDLRYLGKVSLMIREEGANLQSPTTVCVLYHRHHHGHQPNPGWGERLITSDQEL